VRGPAGPVHTRVPWIRAGALLNLSLRGLRARPGRSLTSAAGVAIATAALTTFLALGAGLRQGVERQVDSIRPQLQVSQGGLLNLLAPAQPCGKPLCSRCRLRRGRCGS